MRAPYQVLIFPYIKLSILFNMPFLTEVIMVIGKE